RADQEAEVVALRLGQLEPARRRLLFALLLPGERELAEVPLRQVRRRVESVVVLDEIDESVLVVLLDLALTVVRRDGSGRVEQLSIPLALLRRLPCVLALQAGHRL